MLDPESVTQRPRRVMTLCRRRGERGLELEIVDHIVEEVRLTDGDAHEASVVKVYLRVCRVSLEKELGARKKEQTTWTWKWSVERKVVSSWYGCRRPSRTYSRMVGSE